jgi:methyl-accepting chemotaxis protein
VKNGKTEKRGPDMKLNNLKIGVRLGAGYAILLALMLLMTGGALVTLAHIEGYTEHIVGENDHKIELLDTMSKAIHIVAQVTRTSVLLSDAGAIQTELGKITAARARYDAAVDALEKMPATEAERGLRAKAAAAALAARPLNNQVIELAKAGKDEEATQLLLQQAGPATQKYQDTLDENIAFQMADNDASIKTARAEFERAQMLMIALAGFSLLLGAFIGWSVTRSITRPLTAAMDIAQSVAKGDLTRLIEADGRDETAELMRSLKAMNDSLAAIVGEVRAGTETIATGSDQIAAGNQDLSSRTEQQASSLEETASSMEELTATVRQNADNAQQANKLAQSASGVARKGGAVVAEVVGTMGQINDSARKIAEIIGVIDSIAFQTNILALNAAVEAARAGEEGRGFAVVAAEVRNLAQRSAAAAKEISGLIGHSVATVEQGSKLVDQAGATMGEILSSIERVTDIMSEITAASNEQAAGITQVNTAIAQMDQVTQQNSALVEEAAAAADSLRDQAASLASVVSVFQLGGPALSAPRPQAPAPAPAPARKVVSIPARTSQAVRAPSGTRRLAAANVPDDGGWESF